MFCDPARALPFHLANHAPGAGDDFMNPNYQRLYRMLQAGMRGNDSDTVLCYKHIAADELRKAGYRVSRDTSWVKLSQALRNFAPGCDVPDPRRPQPVICEADRHIIDCMSGQAKDTCMAEMIHLHAVTFRRLRDLGYLEIHARSTPQTLASTLRSFEFAKATNLSA